MLKTRRPTMRIPQDTILIISGVSCVGKTTVAYEILKKYPEFRRVSEADIIRTVVRTAYENLSEEINIDKNLLVDKYNALFKSVTNNNFETTKQQSVQLIPYIKEIVLRQQRRQIPTIIEGAGIVPSTYFPNGKPLEWLTEHVIFINLYLSNEAEHVHRRKSRTIERDYHEDISKTEILVFQSRLGKNDCLHTDTVKIHHLFKNVFSFDVSDDSPSILADKIMEIVFTYYSN